MKTFLPRISQCPKWVWLVLLLNYVWCAWQSYQISYLLKDNGLVHYAVVFLYPSAADALTGLYLRILKRHLARKRAA